MNQNRNQHKSKFLPKLCSSTLTKNKHIKPFHQHHHGRCSYSISDHQDPSSPRVGCMGQVKRNNKVIAFPAIISFNTTITKTEHKSNTDVSTISIVKYHKLKKLFSTATLFGGLSPTATSRVTSQVQTHKPIREREKRFSTASGNSKDPDQKGNLINLEEMDPPLPVLKRVNKEEEEMKKNEEKSSLWKRRSGGVPLKSLQVQVIHN